MKKLTVNWSDIQEYSVSYWDVETDMALVGMGITVPFSEYPSLAEKLPRKGDIVEAKGVAYRVVGFKANTFSLEDEDGTIEKLALVQHIGLKKVD